MTLPSAWIYNSGVSPASACPAGVVSAPQLLSLARSRFRDSQLEVL